MDASSLIASLMAANQPQERENQALIVLGLQNDFIAPDGKLPVPLESGFLDRIKILVPKFRELAGPVIWIRSEFQGKSLDDAETGKIIVDVDEPEPVSEETEDKQESIEEASDSAKKKKKGNKRNKIKDFWRSSGKKEPAQIETPVPEVRPVEDELFLTRTGNGPCCMPGTPGAAFIPEVLDMMRPEDTVIVKSHYSAFTQTSLLITLQFHLKVKELYIVGCMTNLSIFATALDAARQAFDLTLVEDCLGYRTQRRHDIALRAMVDEDKMGALLIRSTEILAQLAMLDDEDEHELPHYTSTDEPNDVPRAENDPYGLNAALGGMHLNSDGDNTNATHDSPMKELSHALSATGLSSGVRVTDTATSGHSRPPTAQPLNGAKAFLEARALRSSRSTPDIRSRANVRTRIKSRNKAPEPVPKVPSHLKTTALSSGLTKPQDQIENISTVQQPQDLTRRPPSMLNEAPNTSIPASKQNHANSSDTFNHTRTQEKPSCPPKTHSNSSQLQETMNNSPRIVTPWQPDRTMKSSYKKNKFKTLANMPSLRPNDKIGEGDSCIKYDLLPARLRDETDSNLPLSDTIFQILHNEVAWQKMYHAAGEVPRLVAVQGQVGEDGSKPVYRHPSDQAPPLLPFTKHVDIVRHQAEELVGHPLNHVLIQLYRTGNDYISEHSDKTLDIARVSSIVNASFGAQRTMRLRTKKSSKKDADTIESTPGNVDAIEERQTQRIHMPHNSLFVLGLETNRMWLHGITQDKRLPHDRTPAELANDSMRISLTFRHIATFLSADERLIWGQGAKGKRREEAGDVVNANDEESESLINAFGFENKEGAGFVWDKTYGDGFDVLNMRKAVLEENGGACT